MIQADLPKKKPSEELKDLRKRVSELEALEEKRPAEDKPLQLKDEPLYKAVFESAHDSLLLVDKKGNILDFNDRLTEIGGYRREDLIGKNFRSLAGMITRKSLVIVVANFLKRMANVHVSPYEVEMYKKNGELLTVEISARPLRKDGKIIGDLAILRDITERKQAEEALKASEQNFHNSLDSSLMGIRIVDEEWHTLYANQVFLDIFGYKNIDEVSTSVLQDHYTPEEYARYLLRKEKRMHGEKVPNTPRVDIVGKSGEIRHLEIYFNEVFWNGKKRRQITYNDVTERQRAEEALKESETRYRELVNTITSGVIIYKVIDNGEDFVFVDINSAAENLDGINRKDIIGKRITEVLPGSKKFNLFRVFQRVWQTGNSEYYSSNWCKDENDPGKWRDNWTYKLPGGEIVNVYDDITERKQAEEALKASEQNFRNSMDSSSMGIRIMGDADYTLYANQAVLDIFGYQNIEELRASPPQEHYTPESYAGFIRRKEQFARGELLPDILEFDIVRKDGAIRHIQLSSKHVLWDGKEQNQILYNDITERKRAEEALKASEQNFRNSIDSSSLGIRISDIENNTLYANQTLLDIFGYKNIDEVIAKSPQDYYSPESYAGYLAMREKYGLGEIIPDHVDIDIIRKDGAVRHLQTSFKIVLWNGKKQYQTFYNDITENKKIEMALRESEEKYRTIFESANDVILLLDIKGKILDVNQRLTDIGGYERDELIGKNVSELAKIISVKSLPIVVANLQKIVAGSGIVTYQVEMLKKNREPVTVEINGVAIRKEGKVVSILAVLKDITERNRSELQIRESEEKYRNIFESANDIILLLDNKGKILDVNRRLTDIGGYEPDELIGKNVSELKKIISKKSLPIIVTNLMKRVAGLGVSTYQVEMVKKNREPVTVEINAVPIRKDGKIVGDLAILRDITERRKSELQIREQKALTDRILKSIPNVVAVVGRDQRIIMVNKAFEHTFELGEGQAEGKNIEKFIPVPHLVDTISQVLASDETQSQVEFRMKQGVVVKIWVADIISMQQNEVLIVLRDITEERELQERLYLTDRLASVGEMAAGIAHELNNPLTGVVALSQLLLENGVPDEMKEDMIAISKEGQRAAEVVRNLLSFARSHTLSASSTQINTVIKEVLNLRAYEHKVNNITVTTNLTPDLPEIMTDRFQMQQVFLNIILNAEHAMIESNGRGNLRVTTEQNTGIIKISFTNDGPAIPPDIINRLFDPFFTTKDVGKGTGLGLSICYGIVTHQGGRIYAQSQEGKGATFIIELPIKAH